jgi:hypothetical protein
LDDTLFIAAQISFKKSDQGSIHYIPSSIVTVFIMKGDEAARLANRCFPECEDEINVNDVQIQPMCRLWAGMGHIYKVSFGGKISGSQPQSQKQSFVVKRVDPPSNRQKFSLGDRRKADSYIVEANFYQHHAKRLREEHSIAIPQPLFVEISPHNTNGQITICMSLLDEASSRSIQNRFEMLAVRWLARFHAATWSLAGNATDDAESSSSTLYADLQHTGGYWHLDTRPDEHRNMSQRGWEGRLKRAARAIDARLKRDPMQCIIHGDPKDANILLTGSNQKNHDASPQVAFCDFQYCGKGCPTKDLAYFLCTSTNPDDEKTLVQAYYEELVSELSTTTTATNNVPVPTLNGFQESLELAYCDFCRFMCGWGMWGFDVQDRVVAVLDRLDGGKILPSEELYDEAIRREFN